MISIAPNRPETHLDPASRRRIDGLVQKAKGVDWSPEDLLSTGERARKPRLVPRRLYASIISQFLHGELATVRLCHKLEASAADPVVREFLALQRRDEARHAHAYALYLERFGGVRPAAPHLGEAVERVLAWEAPPQAHILAFHVLLEGEALRMLLDFHDEWPCPLFHRLNAAISRDEARHVAFGRIYLGATLPQFDRAERLAMYGELKQLWRHVTDGVFAGVRVPGFFTAPLRRRWLGEGWRQHLAAFAELGLLSAAELGALEEGAIR